MYLCIDVGNTRIKTAVYSNDGQRTSFGLFSKNETEQMLSWCRQQDVQHAIVSTTGERIVAIDQLQVSGKLMHLTYDLHLPIKLVYTTPHTLGADRIAAACGAMATIPGKTCLVVSLGTCMTTDLLLASGIYLGGNISPGLFMRLQAMHDYTARLPMVEPGWPELPFGDSTQHALQNGACLAMLMEIEGIFLRAQNAYGEVSIVMTGGDAAFLAERAESQIFVAPELVTYGLYQILAMNV